LAGPAAGLQPQNEAQLVDGGWVMRTAISPRTTVVGPTGRSEGPAADPGRKDQTKNRAGAG